MKSESILYFEMPFKTVKRSSKEGEIIKYPDGKTIENGKIVPVICIMYREAHPCEFTLIEKEYADEHQRMKERLLALARLHHACRVAEEHLELDTDYYAWKDKKIKIRKMCHIRERDGYDPKYYDRLIYTFIYLENMDD